MSGYWYLVAGILILGFGFIMQKGAQIVERLTGRESKPEKASLVAYEVIYFGLAFGVGLPPIYLLPDADPLVFAAFLFLGITIGSLTAQALLGRMHV